MFEVFGKKSDDLTVAESIQVTVLVTAVTTAITVAVGIGFAATMKVVERRQNKKNTIIAIDEVK